MSLRSAYQVADVLLVSSSRNSKSTSTIQKRDPKAFDFRAKPTSWSPSTNTCWWPSMGTNTSSSANPKQCTSSPSVTAKPKSQKPRIGYGKSTTDSSKRISSVCWLFAKTALMLTGACFRGVNLMLELSLSVRLNAVVCQLTWRVSFFLGEYFWVSIWEWVHIFLHAWVLDRETCKVFAQHVLHMCQSFLVLLFHRALLCWIGKTFQLNWINCLRPVFVWSTVENQLTKQSNSKRLWPMADDNSSVLKFFEFFWKICRNNYLLAKLWGWNGLEFDSLDVTTRLDHVLRDSNDKRTTFVSSCCWRQLTLSSFEMCMYSGIVFKRPVPPKL